MTLAGLYQYLPFFASQGESPFLLWPPFLLSKERVAMWLDG